MKQIQLNQLNPHRVSQKGLTLIELLMVIVIIGIVTSLGVTAFQRALGSAYEGRAMANMRSIVAAQVEFHATRGRFGTFSQLINDNGALSDQFHRNSGGAGASEVVSDGRFDYSFRFDREAIGFTLDADPRPEYARRFRRFRFRLRQTARGQVGVILACPPSVESPPDSSYKPIGN
ncbi:MAG TPA: prepilin-type N-terminal cleavage/methylation domain-containing protein [Acidobacteriota bacterium]|nr:prepilin-type N-terminal cleavage/methylation domain-containing protein [Acidobacteriota bacterium]